MPDLMCSNIMCKSRAKCLRYMAKPSEHQYWANFDPKGKDKCDYFLKIEK